MGRGIVYAFAMICGLAVTIAFPAEPSNPVDGKEWWKLAAESRGVSVYTRPHPDSPLKEFRAVGEIDAASRAVHAVIDDLENYASFMPYISECRVMKRESNSILTYQRLSPKICADRDYTLHIQKKSWSGSGGPVYLNWWRPANELGPAEKPGVVRVSVCDGGWLLEPNGANKTRATYSVYTDTGGLIPAFVANRVSQIGIGRLFAAVRKQVKNPSYSANDR